MIHFLIATHGHLAKGFKDTLQIILGKEAVSHVTALCLFSEDLPESEDGRTMIENFFSGLSREDQVVVLTDILYGSVNQMLLPYADDEKVWLLSGVNFPLLCELVSAVVYTGTEICLDVLREMVEKGRKELVLVNDELKKESPKEEETSFFDEKEEEI
ncbi:MAG: hypothetical protein HFI14_01025 [Lachnospiraceae bacterium]|nr:hypothetical protein [Lachnospiraceae bacterium]